MDLIAPTTDTRTSGSELRRRRTAVPAALAVLLSGLAALYVYLSLEGPVGTRVEFIVELALTIAIASVFAVAGIHRLCRRSDGDHGDHGEA